jgi:hypothetical protein
VARSLFPCYAALTNDLLRKPRFMDICGLLNFKKFVEIDLRAAGSGASLGKPISRLATVRKQQTPIGRLAFPGFHPQRVRSLPGVGRSPERRTDFPADFARLIAIRRWRFAIRCEWGPAHPRRWS